MQINRRALIGAAAPLGVVAAAGLTTPAGAEGVGVRRVERWTDAYLAAWGAKDGDAAAGLFTPDAVYQVIPGVAAQTYVGRAAIKDYWIGVTAPQSDFTGVRGKPVVTGNRAAVEVWVTMRAAGANPDGDDWVTLIEANLLTFTRDGLCSRNAEYWHFQLGRITPPAGWGC
ncbi:nuclear transport factor 2 family protein [Actinokineospora enzanensis]|uniref:nuclear transport factor 2 family protein n=1 Tax=Actinokineospora enzanensis TaxID=155975 RepID=UPI0003765124|nr:nuclear transport factor 2 family protein [Actinokineospora enzanensis]